MTHNSVNSWNAAGSLSRRPSENPQEALYKHPVGTSGFELCGYCLPVGAQMYTLDHKHILWQSCNARWDSQFNALLLAPQKPRYISMAQLLASALVVGGVRAAPHCYHKSTVSNSSTMWALGSSDLPVSLDTAPSKGTPCPQ